MENPQVLCSPFNRINIDRPSTRRRSLVPSAHHVPMPTYSPTPPIAVPVAGPPGWQNARTLSGLPENTGGGMMGDRSNYLSEFLSPIEQAARRRRPSIAFDSEVTHECGRKSQLEGPLPRSGKNDYPSLMTDAERCSYESDFGGLAQSPTDISRSGFSRSVSGSFRERRRITAAQKFLMSPFSDGMEGSASSLTSDSTMSPLSEFHTPPNSSLGSYYELGSVRSENGQPLSLGDVTQWPHALENNEMPRNKSFSFESSRARPRQARRRTLSERSMNSCSFNGLSPASMFLSSFGRSSPEQRQQVEPDDEGQEVGSYVLGKEIGRGGFSTVKEAFTFEDGIEIKRAVKIVRKRVHDDDSDNDKVQADFDQEVALWRYLHHPNIMSLVTVLDTPFATFAFMRLNRDGSLFELMKRPENRQGLPARRAQRYSFQLAGALRYLHEDMRIVHGDVKLENCLLDLSMDAQDGGNILLCDFGLAKFIRNPHDDDDESLQLSPPRGDSYCITGSLQYAAPEMIQPPSAEELRTPTVDIWGFAVTVYVLHTGVLPFNHALQPKLAEMILNGGWDVQKLRESWGVVEAGRTATERLVQMLKGCLCTNMERRWDIRDVLESPWFAGRCLG